MTGLHKGYTLRYQILYWLSPRNLIREWKHSKQRKKRGWSEVDTWGGGEHIMEVTAGILRELDKEQNPIDWDQYFEANYKAIKKYEYGKLSEVANDLEAWLEFEKNGLENYDLNFSEEEKDKFFKEHREEEQKLYKAAQNAMHFVAENIGGLWW